jgi:peroxiredoxin (alkyl hydroperoxide reductase subunit C)
VLGTSSSSLFLTTRVCEASHRVTLSPQIIAAISTDSKYSHHAWSQQPREADGLGPSLRIPLLADRNMNVIRSYGCLIEDKGIALRGSYLIDPKGVLRQITVNDLPVGRSVDEALRLVQAFQFTVSHSLFFFFVCVCCGRSRGVCFGFKDEHGEVCPANWREGGKTIRGDPVAKLDYFAAHENGKANGAKRVRVD